MQDSPFRDDTGTTLHSHSLDTLVCIGGRRSDGRVEALRHGEVRRGFDLGKHNAEGLCFNRVSYSKPQVPNSGASRRFSTHQYRFSESGRSRVRGHTFYPHSSRVNKIPNLRWFNRFKIVSRVHNRQIPHGQHTVRTRPLRP